MDNILILCDCNQSLFLACVCSLSALSAFSDIDPYSVHACVPVYRRQVVSNATLLQ